MSGSRGTSSRSRLRSHAASPDVLSADNMHSSRFAGSSRGTALSEPASLMMLKCVLSSAAKKDPNTTPRIVLSDNESHSPPRPVPPLNSPTTTPPSSNSMNHPVEDCVRVPMKILSSYLPSLKPISSTRTASVEQPNHSRQASTILPHHDAHMPDYAPQAFDSEVTHDTVHSQVLKFAVPVMTLPVE
jgi:hypothetical protein